jgi:leader peptidase (prepilin peptidase)/N-methyltransferase
LITQLPLIPLAFVFALGACIGSFLNVVVWRLPRIELPDGCGPLREAWLTLRGLSDPPSHCPKCNNRLRWYDNLPIIGWIKLRGRCRHCREPISMRYPIVEAVTALLFVGYYLAFYVLQWRTCCPRPLSTPGWDLDTSWPIFGLYLATVAALLAASLIDVELYIIPPLIPWLMAIVAFGVHTLADRPYVPGSLNLVGPFGPVLCAASAGGAVGLAIAIALWWVGVLPTSFPEGEPLLDVDREAIAREEAEMRARGEPVPDEPLPPPMTFKQVRAEIGKEMLFLMPALLGVGGAVLLSMRVPAVAQWWASVASINWLTGLLGSLLGAMVGAAVPWVTRIFGTLLFRRVAMGLGDAHLMFGVGAVVGAGGATAAFFLAPAAALAVWLVMVICRRGRRELPFGPYLSLATAVVMLSYCPISSYLTPAVTGLVFLLTNGR